jgi:hypothetical protein
MAATQMVSAINSHRGFTSGSCRRPQRRQDPAIDEPPERDKGQPARRLLVMRSRISHAMGYAQRRRGRAGGVRDLSRAGCDGARSQAPGQAHVQPGSDTADTAQIGGSEPAQVGQIGIRLDIQPLAQNAAAPAITR